MDMYTDTYNRKGQCSVTSIKMAIITLPFITYVNIWRLHLLFGV